MNELQKRVFALLEGLDGSKVAHLLVDFHGTDIIGEDFAKFLVDEGVCGRSELGLDDEDEPDGEDRYAELKGDIVREDS